MKKIIVTIDGPAASGKEKIAKYISKKWKLNHLDSGILYRRLALKFIVDKSMSTNLGFKPLCIIGHKEVDQQIEGIRTSSLGNNFLTIGLIKH